MKKFIFIGALLLIGGSAKAANFGDLVAISTATRFQNRCSYAIHTAAVNVMAESGGTASHSVRVQFARSILAGGGPVIALMAQDVLTNSTISSEAALATLPDYAIPDSDIQFAVNSLFNAWAGVAN